MNRFWTDVIEPLAYGLKPKVIVEIGSDEGAGTEKVLRFCQKTGAHLHVIDPKPSYDVATWRARWGDSLSYHLKTSLEALPKIGAVDLALVDGDHNWYTVRHELEALYAAAAKAGRAFPLVLLHDVCWPYGRRDLYYDPDTVPETHRQPYANAGLLPGEAALAPGRGYNAHCFNATDEGTPRNGVCTAIDDFIADHASDDFALIILPVLFGLAILYRRADPRPAALQHRLDRLPLEPAAEALVALAEQERIAALIEVQEQNRQIEVLKLRLDAVEGTIKNNQAAMGSVSNRLNQARSELANLNAALGASQAMLASTTAELTSTRAELESSRAELESTRAELESSRAEATALHERWAAWEASRTGRIVARLRGLAVQYPSLANLFRRSVSLAGCARRKILAVTSSIAGRASDA